MNDTISKFQPEAFNNQDEGANTTNQQDNSYNHQEIINALLKRNEIQHTNIAEQKKVIENTVSENKELKEIITNLQKEISELKSSFNNNPQNNKDDELLNEIKTLRQRVDSYEEDKRKNQITPLLEMLRDYGVEKDKVELAFSEVQQTYGVNLVNNPNLALLEHFLVQQGYSKKVNDENTSYNINGGYSTNETYHPQTDSQQYLTRKQQLLEEYANYANEKKNKLKY